MVAKAAADAAVKATAEKVAAVAAATKAAQDLAKVLADKATLAEQAAKATDETARAEIQKKIDEVAGDVIKGIDLRLDELDKSEDELSGRSKAVIYEEYEKLRDELLELEKPIVEERNKEIDELWEQENSVSQLHDFMDALSGGKYFQGKGQQVRGVIYGHGQDYYKQKEYRNIEIFTHLNTMSIHNPKIVETLRNEFPDIVNGWEGMIDKTLTLKGKTI